MEAGVATLDPPIDPARDHVRGPADARVTLVEYGDFQCPYCGDAYPVVQELVERYGDNLRFVFRHMPLADLHPRAPAAAEAAEAAAVLRERRDAPRLSFLPGALRADRDGAVSQTDLASPGSGAAAGRSRAT